MYIFFSGFCHQFDIYLGKDNRPSDGKGLSYHVVVNLTRDLVGKFHHVYFDNYFTSVHLAVDLLKDGIYMCGTIRPNRKQFPLNPKELPVRLVQGQYVAKQSDNFIAMVWMDKKHVSVLCTNETVNEVYLE